MALSIRNSILDTLTVYLPPSCRLLNSKSKVINGNTLNYFVKTDGDMDSITKKLEYLIQQQHPALDVTIKHIQNTKVLNITFKNDKLDI